jgi:hypothetical protein
LRARDEIIAFFNQRLSNLRRRHPCRAKSARPDRASGEWSSTAAKPHSQDRIGGPPAFAGANARWRPRRLERIGWSGGWDQDNRRAL